MISVVKDNPVLSAFSLTYMDALNVLREKHLLDTGITNPLTSTGPRLRLRPRCCAQPSLLRVHESPW